MKMLRSRLLELEQREAAGRERARRASAGRLAAIAPSKIRTYNFPQDRVTDHRIGLTLYRSPPSWKARSTN